MAEFPTDVAQQLKALGKMGAPELRALWQESFGRPPPRRAQRDFLMRALAYHLQEKAYGGLGQALRRQLLRYAEEVLITGTRWSGPAFFGLKRATDVASAASNAG